MNTPIQPVLGDGMRLKSLLHWAAKATRPESPVSILSIESGLRVRRLRTGTGGGYKGKAFEDYSLSTDFCHEFVSTHTPHNIGVSECDGSILAAMVRCLFKDSELPLFV